MENRETIILHILERLESDRAAIMADFAADKGIGTRFTAIDDLLPPNLAMKIYDSFPDVDSMRLLDSFREKKYTSKSLDKFDPLVTEATFAFQDQRVIDLVSEITALEDAIGDPHLYAGGISAMAKGHFLNPHIDNSHDHEQKHYRVLNLLYYVTPEWDPSHGGNLELWDEDVTDPLEIPSVFNRLVLMSTNEKSFHSVNEIAVDRRRCCVSNYYFSPHSPNGYETSHVTYFQARPEQKVRRVQTKADSEVRSLLRKVKKSGFGRKDLFEGPAGEAAETKD